MAEAKIRLSVDGASIAKSEIDRVNASLGGLGGGADLAKSALLSLAGTITAGAFLSYIKGAIDAADAMNDMSQRTGILVKDLAVYELAARQSGTSMESISRGVKGLSGVMAANGDALRAAGITATDTNGAMIQLANMFSKMPDSMEKTNLAVKVFDKSGMDLIPMLNMGAIGLAEAAEKANKYAIQMAAMAPMADAFNDNMAEIAINSKVMGMTMLNTALPALNEITKAMAEASQKGGIFAGIMAGLSVGYENHKKNVRELYGMQPPNTGGATGSWADDGRKGLNDPRIVKPTQGKEIDPNTAALIKALSGGGGGKRGGKGVGAEKVSDYDRAIKAANDYITKLKEEALETGATAEQVKMLQAAREASKAPTAELKLLIMTQALGNETARDAIAIEKELAKSKLDTINENANAVEKIQDSTSSIQEQIQAERDHIAEMGLSRDALNALEISRINDNAAAKDRLATLMQEVDPAIADAYRQQADALRGLASAKGEANAKASALDSASTYEKMAKSFSSMSNSASKLGDGFKGATAALSGFADGFAKLSDLEKRENADQKEYTSERMGAYGDMASSAAQFFDKQSTGYEVMMGVSKAFHMAEIALQIASIAPKLMAGAATMFGQSGWGGFVGVAAMAAVMGGLGYAMSGSDMPVGTAGAGNQIGADGRKATNQGVDSSESVEGGKSNYNSASGMYDLQNKPQKTEAEMQAMADAAAINAAANAVANLRIEAMKLTKGSEELELSLARASLAAGGMGKAQHELATQGMNEAELASYNYNQALLGQISVQMDIANGTDLTSDNMKTLAAESRSLAIELMMASGDIAGARAMQRDDDTAGYTAQEVAMYDHNQARRDQIDAMNAGASAAREAASEEDNLSQVRYDLAGRVNVLLGRQTQLQVERAAELVGVTDAVALSMLNLVHTLQDLYDTVDRSFAALQRAVTLEKEKANISLAAATGIASALKSAKDSMVNTPDRASAQAQLAMFAAISKAGGGLPSLEALKPVLASLSKSSDNLFGSKADFQRDFFGTARDIAALSGTADAKVSLEQQNIDRLDLILTNAQSQIDVLKGIDTSVISVESAVRNFAAAMTSLTAAQASAATVTATAPTNTAGSVGSYGGGAAAYVDPTAGMNREIVAAYLKYYARNPDQAGHDAFNALGFKGDLLSQTILHASVADKNGSDYKTAVARGYDPNALPTATRATSTASMQDFGSFAVGYNNLPYDAIVQVHKGEDIVPRPYVDLQASSRDETNRLMERLLQSNEALRTEVAGLKASVQEGNKSAKTTADALGAGARPLTVKVAA
jgi:hypothetical protein